MFARLPDLDPDREAFALEVDGEKVVARSGESVAAALLAAGRMQCRSTAISGAARGPYCMMGVCFECLVTIDGRPGQQACLVAARPGMRVESAQGACTLTIAQGDGG